MTNKEAIFWLNQIKDKYIHGGDESFDQSRRDAIDEAIKALENSSQIIDALEAIFQIVSQLIGEEESE